MAPEPGSVSGDTDTDLSAVVRAAIDRTVYMALGTVGEDGRPWVSPVFFTADAYRDFYWVSSPEVAHSVNLARDSRVSIVVFDTSAPVGQGGTRAVYVAATAVQVPDDDLDRALAIQPNFADRGGLTFTPDQLRAPGAYRLYRATATEHSVLCPRATGEPCATHGRAYDHRTTVDLGQCAGATPPEGGHGGS
jgi:hypothetical protein